MCVGVAIVVVYVDDVVGNVVLPMSRLLIMSWLMTSVLRCLIMCVLLMWVLRLC